MNFSVSLSLSVVLSLSFSLCRSLSLSLLFSSLALSPSLSLTPNSDNVQGFSPRFRTLPKTTRLDSYEYVRFVAVYLLPVL